MNNILPLTPNIILITESRVFYKRTGEFLNLSDSIIQNEMRDHFYANKQLVTNISDDVEQVSEVGSQQISFNFKTSDGVLNSKNGFLIEVYESGSETSKGALTRLYSSQIQDALDESKSINDSFSNYFTLEVDVVDTNGGK
jgi:hypothetical protein